MAYSYSNNYNLREPSTSYANSSNIPKYMAQPPNPPRSFSYQYSDPRYKPNNAPQQPLQFSGLDRKTDDELWVETYLAKIGKVNLSLQSNFEIINKKPVQSINKKPLKIGVAKSLLHNCIRLLKDLEQLEEYLRANVVTMSSVEWKEKTIKIGQQKDEFTALVSQLDSCMMEQVKKTLNKRKRKRLSQKRKKAARREEKAQTEKNRLALHKTIDQWLDKMKEDVHRAKREEYLKKDADCILSEVTKKKSDARKQLSLLASLVKLRAVREMVAQQRGEKISLEDSKAFAHNTEKLKSMWENALKVYGIEEQGLRLMLKQNTNDDLHVPVSEEKKITSEWETVLFGPKVIPPEAYWSLTCADKDLGTFIAIRRSWDTFLVPDNKEDGSRIPIGWILPCTTATETAWSKYLQIH